MNITLELRQSRFQSDPSPKGIIREYVTELLI